MSRLLATSIDRAIALDDARRDLLEAAHKFGSIEERNKARDELMASAQSFITPKPGEAMRLRLDEDGTAYIPIMGGLTPSASPCGAFAEGTETEYGFIRAAIQTVENDSSVTNVVFDTDSGGGDISGLDETAQDIANMKKPTSAIVHNVAASAAYYLISQTDKIIALSPMAQIGSIGIVSKAFAGDGKGVTFVSSGAPNKRPDLATDEGRAIIQARIDSLHDVFVRRVTEGRGIDEKKVRADFGQGDLLLAEKAMSVGMIDDVVGSSISRRNKTGVAGDKASAESAAKISGGQKMTLDEYKAANPGVLEAHDKVTFDAGCKAEATRRDGLSAFVGKTKEGDAAVAEAISSGKSVADAMPSLIAATIPSSMTLANDNAPTINGKTPENGAGTDGLSDGDKKAMEIFGLTPEQYKAYNKKEGLNV